MIIFGGGDVGARKASYFSGQSDVLVISRSFSISFDDLHVRKTVIDIAGIGDAGLITTIKGAFLVIAATSDPGLNDRIGGICSKLRGSCSTMRLGPPAM